MSIFDAKIFNAEVFGKYLETVPRVKQNALIKSGILRTRSDLKNMLSEQAGGNYISVPMTGLIDGAALNYDGSTDITATGIDTYLQSMIVCGRAKSWKEKDFSFDITGHDFMGDIASQVSNYWDDIQQATLLSILSGIFGVTEDGFSERHTLDISEDAADTVGATTLNNAIQKAAGANKNIFTMAIMHSAVATNLENLQLLEYMKQNDANGIQRDVGLATWNGRTVIIDDDVPVETISGTAGVYTVTIGGTVAEGDNIVVLGVPVTLTATTAASATTAATAVVSALGTSDIYTINRSGAVITFTEKSGHYGAGAPVASISSAAGTVAVATTTPAVVSGVKYTTYILGHNAFDYCDCGAKVPYETYRSPLANGGEDMLITRQRKLYAPRGFSFIQPSATIISPTDEQYASAERWSIVKNTSGSVYYNSKAIPLARIISKG